MKSNFRNITVSPVTITETSMICLVASWAMLGILFGEVVPAGDGLGWDGLIYADITRHLNEIIAGGNLSEYYAQRILPSIAVREILLLSGSSLSDFSVVNGFRFLNAMVILCGTVVWNRIASHFEISSTGRWIGFVSIFVNFISSKQSMYTPVATDSAGILVSLFFILFYVKESPIGLLFTMVAGSFVWQTSVQYGLILIVSMYMTTPQDCIDPDLSSNRRHPIVNRAIKIGWPGVLFLSILLYTGLIYFYPAYTHGPSMMLDFTPTVDRDPHTFWDFATIVLSNLPSQTAVVIAVFTMIGSLEIVRSALPNLRTIRLTQVVVAIIGVFLTTAIRRAISNPNLANANGFSQVLTWITVPDENTEGKFLLSPLTLALVWGPAVLLFIVYWRTICVEIRRLGPGVMAVVGLTLPLALVTEPRYVLGAYPFVVLALVRALERTKYTRLFLCIFFGLSILYAQFWLKLNISPWRGRDYEGLQAFPKQMLFMHYGFWMSWTSYVVQLPLVILSGLCLLKVAPVNSSTSPARNIHGQYLPPRIQS